MTTDIILAGIGGFCVALALDSYHNGRLTGRTWQQLLGKLLLVIGIVCLAWTP